MKFKFIILVIIILSLFTTPTAAAELENYYLQTSFSTYHYSEKDYQNNQQQLIGIERHYSDKDLNGIAFFKNTYDQSTVYVYTGRNYLLADVGKIEITAKFTYGIIHGYDDENGKYGTWMHEMGTFPGAVFGFGLRKEPFRLDILPFADAGVIITGGVEF